MEISSRIKEGQFVELTLKQENTTMVVDLTTIQNKKWAVPNELIAQFVSLANDCSRFNGVTDVDFVMGIVESLNESERQELIERLTKSNHGE